MNWLLLFLVVVAGLGFLTAVLRTFDLGGPFRDAILAVSAQRLKNRYPLPDSVERTYWSGLEYQRDATRLAELGYEVTSETDTSSYVGSEAFPGRAPIIRRAPSAHITYELRKQP